jgi:DNA invertase Pin-like site-specific DNA recombinase
VSAFHGRNVEVGAFLRAVEDGRVPRRSYLLVKSLDRVSRQTARKAANVLGDIVDAGIVVIDMEDGAREYNKDILDSDPFAFVMVVLRFVRAHQESAMKGTRVSRQRSSASAEAASTTNRRQYRMQTLR